jgi:hypothetical protein
VEQPSGTRFPGLPLREGASICVLFLFLFEASSHNSINLSIPHKKKLSNMKLFFLASSLLLAAVHADGGMRGRGGPGEGMGGGGPSAAPSA